MAEYQVFEHDVLVLHAGGGVTVVVAARSAVVVPTARGVLVAVRPASAVLPGTNRASIALGSIGAGVTVE